MNKMNKNGLKCTIVGLLLSSGLVLQAQNTSTNVEESSDKHVVETNHFFDNCFIGAGIGGQIYFGNNDSKYSLTDRITPSLNFYVGKWFTPGMGIRAGIDASNAKGLTSNNYNWYTNFYNTGDIYSKDGVSYYEQKIKYVHFNAEALFNVTNLVLGYKEDRFYNFIPYVGGGYIASSNKSRHEEELTAVGGILNTFRLGRALSLTFDVKGTILNGSFSHKKSLNEDDPANADQILSASIGVVYKFKKRDWNRSKIVTNTVVDNDALNDLRKKMNDLTNENDQLKKQLGDANAINSKTSTTIVDRSIIAPPLLITFPINKWTLSKEARVNLGYFAKVVKNKPGVVYILTGYADKGTGTPERNELLSRERVNVVYNSLINEFGVKASQLKTEYKGGVDNMFYDDPRLSRAVIAFEVEK